MGKGWTKRKPETCPECGKEFKFLAQHIRMAHGKETTVTEENNEGTKQPDVTEAIKGIGERLDKIDSDFCSHFPDLCEKVDRLEQAIPDTVEQGSERWTTARKADLEHALFEDCPDCKPVTDAVLAARGKRLADVEPETKVDEEEEQTETKVDEEEAKVEDVEEKRTSGGYFPGSVWDEEKELYVEQ